MKNIVFSVLEAALLIAVVVGVIALFDGCATNSLYYEVNDFVNS